MSFLRPTHFGDAPVRQLYYCENEHGRSLGREFLEKLRLRDRKKWPWIKELLSAIADGRRLPSKSFRRCRAPENGVWEIRKGRTRIYLAACQDGYVICDGDMNAKENSAVQRQSIKRAQSICDQITEGKLS